MVFNVPAISRRKLNLKRRVLPDGGTLVTKKLAINPTTEIKITLASEILSLRCTDPMITLSVAENEIWISERETSNKKSTVEIRVRSQTSDTTRTPNGISVEVCESPAG